MQGRARCQTALADGRAGIQDFRWHDLRHTFATWHREAGTRTHELQRLGGWKTQSMVERYAPVAPEGLQVAASRLDWLLRGDRLTAQGHNASQ
nr:tyrosine-type recombinase/integrase [Rhodoferax ferrireducens]